MIMSVKNGSQKLTLMRKRHSEANVAANASSKTGKIDPARPGIDFPVRTTASGFLSGEVFIDGIGKPLNFIIDTGATISDLSLRAAALEEARPFIQPGNMRGFGAAGTPHNAKTAALPRVA